ncbi:dTDP-4-dehydrorhamnose reductase [Pseudothioglobus sp. nBUS_23]|uniref:dTDP-4-dehydrorhamnose reductase n=1 Tax=Pseudothioglobus sp. nBUS_23 TaxID=3395318 RepID=UPI003EC0E3F5
MNILVTGSNSQLGKSLKQLSDEKNISNNFVFTSREQLDLSSITELEIFIESGNFDFIVNFAAYTSVDEAENNKKQAYIINHLAVKRIAEISKKNQIKLIHLSSDFVFDGSKNEPYNENDNAFPINIYGKSKYAGEQAILKAMKTNAIILRTSWMYSEYGNNFVDTILRLSRKNDTLNVVTDQIGNPTYARDLSQLIMKIIMSDKINSIDQSSEIFHYSNEGSCSWYDFAREVIKISGNQCIINPILSKKYPSKAIRPKNSSMSKKKVMNEFNIKTTSWKDSLKKCIDNISK